MPQFETFAVVEDEDQAEPFAPLATDEFETNAAPGSTFSDPTASFADLNEDESAPFATAATDFQEVDFSIVSTPDTPVVVDEAAPADEGRQENVMRQELESVDFYIAQGYADIAIDTLEMLERQFGPHPEIQSRREKLAQRNQPVEEAAVFEFGGVEEAATATPVPEDNFSMPTARMHHSWVMVAVATMLALLNQWFRNRCRSRGVV